MDPARLVEPGEGDNLRALNVRDAMATQVISVRSDCPLKDLARELTTDRIGALPVLDNNGQLIGIVSYLDALRVLA